MNELLNTTIASYGPFATIILFALLLIFAIITLLLPLFIWGIHNQTTRATRELIKLNKLVAKLKLQQPSHAGVAKHPSTDSRTEEMVEEIFNKNRIETPGKDKLPEVPAQTFKRRKVFIKPEDEVPDPRKKIV